MALPRFQLFELEDCDWFPSIVRDFSTDYLRFVQTAMRLHEPVVPVLADALLRSGSTEIVDLCSGASGPIVPVLQGLRDRDIAARATLTDRFPNTRAFERARSISNGWITYVRTPVDARSVPRELRGFRTIFNAFHHFSPDDARAIIRDAVAARQPLGIFEIPERTHFVVLSTLLAPLMVLVATPFIQPFRWSRLLLTYIVPAVPLTSLWDGVVSQLRAYTCDELRSLVRDVGADHYTWKIGKVRIRKLPSSLTYLVGYPEG